MSAPDDKGSAPRPRPLPKFAENWDHIFGKKDQ